MSKHRRKVAPVENYSFPSRFGSHTSMVNQVVSATLVDKSLVVLTDEHGDYLTLRSRLDSGLHDRNRTANYTPGLKNPNLRGAFWPRQALIDATEKVYVAPPDA